MNLTIKAVYYCATNQQRWGKALSIAEAKKNAGLKKGMQYYVMAALLDNPSDEELELARQCVVADQFFGSPIYAEDSDQVVLDKHVGWLTVEKNY